MERKQTILHIGQCDKFLPPFIEFVRDNFDFSEHEFLLTNGVAAKYLKDDANVFLTKKHWLFGRGKHYWRAAMKMHQADKIILHGLFDKKLIRMLFFMPWLLKKCYWLVWGGDLYLSKGIKKTLNLNLFYRRFVIKGVGYIVTSIDGDYRNVVDWYQAKGKRIKVFTYPASLYVEMNSETPEKSHCGLNMLLGNSADPTNQHLLIFDKIRKKIRDNAKIYVPLSYGNEKYRDKVVEEGKKLFGERFHPMTELLPLTQYNELLASVDIAIFAHQRQQAMSNIRTLIGMGKKVYIHPESSAYEYLENLGLKIFDFSQIGELSAGFPESEKNQKIIAEVFSKSALTANLERLFND